MSTIFENLIDEKRERILQIAVQEFAAMGYESASTNSISKKANISKGSLFQYFPSKKELFRYLCEYNLHIILEEYFYKIDFTIPDIFERFKQVFYVRMLLLKNHPKIFDFTHRILEEKSKEVTDILDSKTTILLQTAYEKLFVNIDESKFKPELPLEKLEQILIWVLISYRKKLILSVDDIQLLDGGKVEKEYFEYLDILRVCFYK